jgi:asparagine synthase (glutamine-hydrolysing)
MCGIAGHFSAAGAADKDQVRRMCEAITHRGPDADGFYADPQIALGMRRLSIIDLAGGQQPLYNETQDVVLIFNGEIYNYIELRAALIKKGHRFATQSDGETIAHLYEEKGIDALNDLNGMFSICLWDKKRQTGYLVRDRLGIKPLYYFSDGNALTFASELKALKAVLPAPPVNAAALNDYLQFMYIPGAATPFESWKKLRAGHYMEFGAQGVQEPKAYWRSNPGAPRGPASTDNLRGEFLDLLDSAVALQLRSDVPVGVFLSGGIDSSLITALYAKKTSQPVLSYNVEYEGAPGDESAYAQKVAALYGCRHHSVKLGLREFLQKLPQVLWHMDEPTADHAAVAAFAVSELARRDVKVALNGSGGDEIMGGYDRHRPNSWPLALWHRVPGALQSAALSILKGAGAPASFLGRAAGSRNADDTYLWRLMQFKPRQLAGFNAGYAMPAGRHAGLAAILESAPRGDVNRYLHLNFYLPDDLLLLLDKTTMAASIEGRVPLLDHRLVEWSYGVPGRLKVSGAKTKMVFKEWLRGLLPDEILNRPKMGFGAPIRWWMKDGLFDACVAAVERRPVSRNGLYWGLRGAALREKMAGLNFQQNYALLVLELWFCLFIDGKTPEELSGRLAQK